MSASLVAWSPWTLALGWTLLHFVWQGALIGAGFAAVRADQLTLKRTTNNVVRRKTLTTSRTRA
jgi:hypothetical protein